MNTIRDIPTDVPISGRDPQADTAQHLRLVTWNIHLAKNLHGVRDLLGEIDADICCLQEVMVDDPRRTPSNQADWFARHLQYRHINNVVYPVRRHGLGGNAVLCRWPVRYRRQLIGPTGRPFALHARLDHPRGPFDILCCHLSPVPRPVVTGVFLAPIAQTAEARAIVRWADRRSNPALIAGDFNVLPHWPAHYTITRALTDCTRVNGRRHNTRPTLGRPAQIDYVFANAHITPNDCRVIDSDLSDHRPLVCKLYINNKCA